MKKCFAIICLSLGTAITAFGQHTVIKGSILGGATHQPLSDVTITIEETGQTTFSTHNGTFTFILDVPLGEQILKLEKPGYITKRYPVIVNINSVLEIQDMMLEKDLSASDDLYTIMLSEEELNDDTDGGYDNVSGLLQASQDVFHRTAAFEFSSSFFKIRGMDSQNGQVLINGIAMNKSFTGRPEWNNWGGLNDVLRNQELATNLTPSFVSFGGALGSTNMNTRASNYRKGGRLTYSLSDRIYSNRVIASYASGLLAGGWSISAALGRRWGAEGYQEATFYDANSLFLSVENKINDQHSLNLSTFYAPTRRGKSSANTQEVYDLKGTSYNEYWGYQDGQKRNSRVKEVKEPLFILNHFWKVNPAFDLNTNIAYQSGKIGNSRLDYSGGANPSPAYYQKLPSYALSDSNNPNYADAYLLEKTFIKEGQIDWNRMYDANITNKNNGLPAAYALYEDRNDDNQITINSIFTSELSDHITLNGSVEYKYLKSENFALIKDLLGGESFLNVDAFDHIQYDLKYPDKMVTTGDRFKYNYGLGATSYSGFLQAQFKYRKMDVFGAIQFSNVAYQREGYYQHEHYADNSFGKGPKVNFFGLGFKGGTTYKISGKHVLKLNLGYFQNPPTIRDTYSNIRENNNIVKHIKNETQNLIDFSYVFRSSLFKSTATAYFIKIKDATRISYYYADGLSNFEMSEIKSSAFVQEILNGIDKNQFGLELGIEASITSTIKLKGVAAIGQFTYANNPSLYLTSSSFINPEGVDYASANLKNYKLATGPQTAYSLGFEYRDPDYWWFGATVNLFDNAYIDTTPLTRTKNFYTDSDGLPFVEYDPEIAKVLLKQEKFEPYTIVNLVGGKSWKINKYFLGLFASINNLFDTDHKTGGYEQGRNADYRSLQKDFSRETGLFGSKYWYGRGTTYFLNAYIRF